MSRRGISVSVVHFADLGAILLFLACFAYALPQSNQTAQPDTTTKNSADEVKSSTAHPNDDEAWAFRWVLAGDGWTKSGARFGFYDYKSPTGITVRRSTSFFRTREGAKEEYDSWLKNATKIIEQGRVGDDPVRAEYRAVILVAAARDCSEVTQIGATMDDNLRVISSCSAKTALDFEKLWTSIRSQTSAAKP